VEVDIGSEFRYRRLLLDKNVLTLSISQSGETADTLAGTRLAAKLGSSIITICNVVGSTMTREADATLYTHAGPEIGVASTKAFTSQLAALFLFASYLGQLRKTRGTPFLSFPPCSRKTSTPSSRR
jgi:glucosamine--fructose-6-phosphate aminotransferase (isomerizing)